jgi:RimJ/RimL family protein N-acetyltransferase/N-acetylglutamate synthase-like GNAT family acetyltransferase
VTNQPEQPVGPPVDATPAPRPQRTTLSGRFVRVVPLDAERHLDDLFACMGGLEQASLWTYMFDGPFADHAAFAEAMKKRQASNDPLFFAIEEAESNRAVGIASYMRIDPLHRVIEVGGIVFSPPLQRKPGATEAMYLMARHVFEDLGYRRYEWKCDALNAPSWRAALRLGFTFEGIFRAHMIIKGRSRDTAWFSMLDSEWPARKAAFEAWLAPDSFNQGGEQKQSLSAMNRARSMNHLRRARAEEAGKIAAFQRAAYERNRAIMGVEPIPLQADYATILRDYEVWLHEEGDRLAGVLILEPRADDLLIWSVATAPDARGSGRGNRLLAAAESRGRELGRRIIRLYTGELLVNNVAWYQRQGFAIERREAMSDRRVVHMIKTIAGE